ncbi:maleylpyruvate isomerase N-terminal domain-containing protein [Microbacterium elymi]|uniref:Maleylpyruvate isomerase N-terminal domain-containing protein n=1 Tax=Microbacterium elymi TaxID=2909587 RepID=A0ABY5NM47_9MICO|nr:maleylpyruvate isomerase N-terminal domain-containing protein [Microbacterium elymi]UUT36220.1 maleylpyruvate isomerase N-terminal domain-containing protein [Microbacterium elymi]
MALLARVTAAFDAEIEHHAPTASIAWDAWPTVSDLIGHLGQIHLWAARIVRTGNNVPRKTLPPPPVGDRRRWYGDCRRELLAALTETPPERPCWVLGESAEGEARFWSRRLVYESVKHLTDLRAAGGASWRPAPELAPVDYADGIDELFEVFLPRSRPSLDPLPEPVTLAATDIDRTWTIARDWRAADAAPAAGGSRVTASVADLALFMWERADPGRQPERFLIEGGDAAVAALANASVHP